MTTEEIIQFLKNKNIKVEKLREHTKATEKYVDVIFTYNNQNEWKGSVPYYYRRTGLFLDSGIEVAKLLENAYESLKKENYTKWITEQRKLWNTEYLGRTVTKSFFDVLLNLKWNAVECDFPPNPNWARRIQDIKEMGYILATDTRKYSEKLKKNVTQILLVPLEKGSQTGYEVFSSKLRKKIIKVLGYYDAYEGKVRPGNSLLPDHKFPEISWDEHTRVENPEDMTDDEIRDKFQLLDNQRNLEKREACRKVIQTGKVGTLFGINYYINGSDKWPNNIPKIGKESIQGWKLCPWYDIENWRKLLNKSLKSPEST